MHTQGIGILFSLPDSFLMYPALDNILPEALSPNKVPLRLFP